MSGSSNRVRWRWTLWSTAVLVVVLAAFGAAIYVVFDAALIAQGRAQLEASLRRVEALTRDELEDGKALAGIAEELAEESDVAFHAVAFDGGPAFESEAWTNAASRALDEAVAARGEHVVELASGVILRVGVRSLSIAGHDVVLAAAADESSIRASRRTFVAILASTFPLAALLALACGWWLAGRMLAPVRALADGAEGITADRLSERLPVRRDVAAPDEFDRLASSFNRALDRVEEAFTRLRSFTADASHELRTPLTAMRMVGEVALADSCDRGNADRSRDAIGSMLEEMDRLSALVDRLLTLTRADAHAYRARFETVDLATLAREVAETLQPIAEDRGLELDVEAPGSVPVRVDVATVRQAVLNLVDNALRYTPRGGRVAITCVRRGDECVLAVADSGLGIAREDQARIFERFVRLDPSRSNADDGALPRGHGLGLAIAKWAIELNGGRIELDSVVGRGSTFRVVLPLASGV